MLGILGLILLLVGIAMLVLGGRGDRGEGDGGTRRGGILAMVRSDHPGPINIGNPHEIAMVDLANWIVKLAESDSPIVHIARPIDDPTVRRPDTTLAQQVLGWSPQVPIEQGLQRTIAWFRANAGTAPPLSAEATQHILTGH